MLAAVQFSKDLGSSTRYELMECKLHSLVCKALLKQEKQMYLSSVCTFTSASASMAGSEEEELQGTAPEAVPCHTGRAHPSIIPQLPSVQKGGGKMKL